MISLRQGLVSKYATVQTSKPLRAAGSWRSRTSGSSGPVHAGVGQRSGPQLCEPWPSLMEVQLTELDGGRNGLRVWAVAFCLGSCAIRYSMLALPSCFGELHFLIEFWGESNQLTETTAVRCSWWLSTGDVVGMAGMAWVWHGFSYCQAWLLDDLHFWGALCATRPATCHGQFGPSPDLNSRILEKISSCMTLYR